MCRNVAASRLQYGPCVDRNRIIAVQMRELIGMAIIRAEALRFKSHSPAVESFDHRLDYIAQQTASTKEVVAVFHYAWVTDQWPEDPIIQPRQLSRISMALSNACAFFGANPQDPVAPSEQCAISGSTHLIDDLVSCRVLSDADAQRMRVSSYKFLIGASTSRDTSLAFWIPYGMSPQWPSTTATPSSPSTAPALSI